jgi:hypothetical protein
MPLPTNAYLPYGKARRAALKLHFIEHKGKQGQKRQDGRTALTPEINLRDYRFRAVVDWIKFRVTYMRSSNFMTTQALLGNLLGKKCFVEAVDPGAGGESSVFDIVVQEPASFALILKVYSALAVEFGEGAEPAIIALEISLDAYPRTPCDKGRGLMVGVMQRTIFTSRDIWTNRKSLPRSVKATKEDGSSSENAQRLLKKARGKYPTRGYLRTENHLAPWIDGTMYLGADDDDVMIRVQNKTTDQRNPKQKTFRALNAEEMRARIEVTLKGQELRDVGLITLKDLPKLEFGKLQGRYFQFKLPTFQTTPISTLPPIITSETERRRAVAFLESGVVGLQARDDAFATYREDMAAKVRRFCRDKGKPYCGRRPGTGITGTLLAYEILNRLAATAFRKLGEREERAWKR